TVKMTADENLEMLNKQRSVRPNSPHFTIYQPQLTWLGSIANRITGVGLSVGLYAYGLAYISLPLMGYGDLVSSAYLTSLAASAPFWLKLSIKAPIAAAFNYHTFNGLRHLGWDRGYFISVKGCYQSGYAVFAATALATVGLCLI
ncbi:cytochrome b560 subunit of succinate dehydrogenase, partial [Microstroma glucosiphilum]